MLAIFQQIGLPEILLILAVLLFLFGARKLPELARSLGKSTKEFKQGMRDGPDEETPAGDGDDQPRAQRTTTPE
ncbi:MAG TPA: twin-arginine translocase TatA/TatE family subunit [Actinomycetota bacterium]|jgi:sec-independent protein translocase protein TatA|nr:twin-arginine translocase TatA/TatE family subunit [Actinomycetota bacterium]